MKKPLGTTLLLAGCSLALEGGAFAQAGQSHQPGDSAAPEAGSEATSRKPVPVSGGWYEPGVGELGICADRPSTHELERTAWTFWWEFDGAPYLNLRAHVFSGRSDPDGCFPVRRRAREKGSLGPTEAQVRGKVVPALLHALETGTNNDLVTNSLIALAKIGDPPSKSGAAPFAKAFVKRLADPNQEISETAAIALGILGEDAAVDTLGDLLADTERGRALVGDEKVNSRTRAFAACGLGLIGQRTGSESTRKTIVQDLTAAIAADDTKSRDLEVACIVSLGLVPLETLEAPAQEPEKGRGKEKKDQPVDASQSRIDELRYLDDFLQDDGHDDLARAHCPTAMARLLEGGMPGEKRAEWTQRIAEDLLGRIGEGSKDPAEIQESAVIALGLLGDADAGGLDARIRKALIDMPKALTDEQARAFALIALARSGGRRGAGDPARGIAEAGAELRAQLASGTPRLASWAALALGVLGRELEEESLAPETVAALASALRAALGDAQDPRRVGPCAIGLGMLRDDEAAGLLRDVLQHCADEEARGYVAVALGLIEDREAVEPIQDVLAESMDRPQLLRQAAIALGLLGDKQLVETLSTRLHEVQGLATQAALCSALGGVGDQRSIDPLVAMLQNEELTESARGFAAVALGIVCGEEPLPWSTRIAVDLNYRASTESFEDRSGIGILDIP